MRPAASVKMGSQCEFAARCTSVCFTGRFAAHPLLVGSVQLGPIDCIAQDITKRLLCPLSYSGIALLLPQS